MSTTDHGFMPRLEELNSVGGPQLNPGAIVKINTLNRGSGIASRRAAREGSRSRRSALALFRLRRNADVAPLQTSLSPPSNCRPQELVHHVKEEEENVGRGRGVCCLLVLEAGRGAASQKRAGRRPFGECCRRRRPAPSC